MHDHQPHDHSHTPETTPGEMSETDKILKRLHHWVHHNDEHAASYRDWAGRIEAMGIAEAAQHLNEAADMTDAISREFEAAAAIVGKQATKA